jgi:hypothetical protein
VLNGTTGAFTVTFKTPSGSGVIVPMNGRGILECDGANVFSLLAYASGGINTIGGGIKATPTGVYASPNGGAETPYVGSYLAWGAPAGNNAWISQVVQPTGVYVDNGDLVFLYGASVIETFRLRNNFSVGGAGATLTGSLKVTTGISVGGATAGAGGLAFPASQVAIADPNTLDDYEEGTFSPAIAGTTVAGTGTYTTQLGRYTKVGNLVTARIYLAWTAHTGTGSISLTGLPFTVAQYACGAVWNSNLALTAGSILQAYAIPGASSISTEQVPSGGGASSSVPMDTSASLMVTVTYEV